MSSLFKLSAKLQEVFSDKFIKRVAFRTKFVQRKSKLNEEKFLALTVFHNDDLCTSTLEKLSSELAAQENIKISGQGLNNRINEYAVEFMKQIFNATMHNQNEILNSNGKFFCNNFNRIRIADSTEFVLPKEFQKYYKGFSKVGSEACAKIQLEYDLNTGAFLNFDILDGNSSDLGYLPNLYYDIEPKDLHIKDLGYFDSYYFKLVAEKGAYFLSRTKCTVALYVDNKGIYEKLDIPSISRSLYEGEVLEIPKVYVSKKRKVECRLIITKLTEEQKKKREKAKKKTMRRKGKTSSSLSDEFNNIEVYITNVPSEILSKELVHDIYSLRWQIEIMFKIWKSIFKIHAAKDVKIERFYCCLYGKLISMLISSDIFFTLKKNCNLENGKELSEKKGFEIIKEFMLNIREKIFKGKETLYKLMIKIKRRILQGGKKSNRYGKDTPFDILKKVIT